MSAAGPLPPVMSCAWYPVMSLCATPSSRLRCLLASRSLASVAANSARSFADGDGSGGPRPIVAIAAASAAVAPASNPSRSAFGFPLDPDASPSCVDGMPPWTTPRPFPQNARAGLPECRGSPRRYRFSSARRRVDRRYAASESEEAEEDSPSDASGSGATFSASSGYKNVSLRAVFEKSRDGSPLDRSPLDGSPAAAAPDPPPPPNPAPRLLELAREFARLAPRVAARYSREAFRIAERSSVSDRDRDRDRERERDRLESSSSSPGDERPRSRERRAPSAASAALTAVSLENA